jgi:hypothetical protein
MPRRKRATKRRDDLTLERELLLTLGPMTGRSCPEPGSEEWEALHACWTGNRDRLGTRCIEETWGYRVFELGDVEGGLRANALVPCEPEDGGDDDAPVFASAVGTVLIPEKVRSGVLRPAAKSVGLLGISFHTFRHTCASMLFEAGRNVKQVQEWLGHADPGFTLRTYVHLMDAGVGDAEFLDAAVRVDKPSEADALGV